MMAMLDNGHPNAELDSPLPLNIVEIAEQVLTSVKNSKNAFLTPEISVCQVTALSQSGFVDITVGITIGITNGITNDQSRNLRYER